MAGHGRGGRHVWVLPALFVLVTLSLPAQMLVASRVSEPFPGLFFPRFSEVPDLERGYTFDVVSFAVDGRSVAPETVFNARHARATRLSRKAFPRTPDGPVRLKPGIHTTIVSNLTRATGKSPQTLEVAWTRRRYDINTGKTADIETYPPYEVALRGGT